jgi:hypothetical protein
MGGKYYLLDSNGDRKDLKGDFSIELSDKILIHSLEDKVGIPPIDVDLECVDPSLILIRKLRMDKEEKEFYLHQLSKLSHFLYSEFSYYLFQARSKGSIEGIEKEEEKMREEGKILKIELDSDRIVLMRKFHNEKKKKRSM